MEALVFRTNLVRMGAAFLYRGITKKIAMFPGKPLTLVHLKEPKLPPGEYVKVRTRLCGICGTDLRILGIEVSLKSSVFATAGEKAKAPLYLGHEVVGEVVEAYPDSKFRMGQRVALADDVNCSVIGGQLCDLCLQGCPVLCLRRSEKKTYAGSAGGWSEYFIRHESQLIPIPDALPDETAVLAEPLACSLHTVLRRLPKEGNRILVLGSGMIGLGVVAALRALGIPKLDITVLARHQFQKDKAIELGANQVVLGGDLYEVFSALLGTRILGKSYNRILANGFDLVYDCVGQATTLNDALRWVRPRGAVVLAGMNMIPSTLDYSPVWHREIDLVGVHGYACDDFEGERMHTIKRCLSWMSTGRLRAGQLLTHRFPLSQYQEAIRTTTTHHRGDRGKAESARAIKVAFDFRKAA